MESIEGKDLIHHNGKIYIIPSALRQRVLDWYHTMIVHPGETTRMEKSIRSVYTWKEMRRDVQQHCKHCKTSQLFQKSGRKKYGLLHAKNPETTNWRRVNVDLWGSTTVKNKNGNDHKIHVMTMIDPPTGWFEVVAALKHGATALEAHQRLLDSQWLARY